MIGFILVLQVALVLLALICFMPFFLVLYFTRNRMPAWASAPEQLLKNMAEAKFAGNDDEEENQCSICLLPYKYMDIVTPLPCD